MASSSDKLHPIYVALDAHQYNRAIKLGLAIPETNVLGKVLLAHAYSKAGQRHDALLELLSILVLRRGLLLSSSTSKHFFWELQHEVESSLSTCQQKIMQQQQQQSSSQPPQQPQQSSSTTTTTKKGKKGKKKPSSSSSASSASSNNNNNASQSTTTTSTNTSSFDWIDPLLSPPILPKDWDILPPPELAITDETTLSTLSVTLQSLKLPLTVYQLHAWAVSAVTPMREGLLTKTFTLGLSVLASPSKWTITSQYDMMTSVLVHLQAIALQWARLVVTTTGASDNTNFSFLLATSWATQTALWQLQWLPSDTQRSLILPRLAESMSRRLLVSQSSTDNNSNSNNNEQQQQIADNSTAAELQLLCLRTLEHQSKWNEMLEILSLEEQRQSMMTTTTTNSITAENPNDPDNNMMVVDEQQLSSATMSEFGVALTRYQVFTEKARILQQMEQYDEAKQIYQSILQDSNPDDWSCWMGYWICCRKVLVGGITDNDNNDHYELALQSTTELIETILTPLSSSPTEVETTSRRRLRGPNLMKVELAAESLRRNRRQQSQEEESSSSSLIQELIRAIQTFGNDFARRSPCTFSDLNPYLELVLEEEAAVTATATNNIVLPMIESLLEWATTLLQQSSSSAVATEDTTTKEGNPRYQLRAYIFAARLIHKLLSKFITLQDRFLPNWKDLVKEWQLSLELSTSKEGEVTQKEIRPGDELILLAIQQLLYCDPGSNDALVTAAVLLETAIHHSPDNAYLKMSAIEVYYQLDAMSRSWEFYQAIGLKHIQQDSCTFTVLPYLLSGGLYNETIEVCNGLLRFQASTVRDCGEYAGRAMQAGTLSKANEFLVFQRDRMNRSLTVLQAKGVILDSAAVLANVVPRKKHDDNPIFQGALGIHQGIVGGDADLGRATQMVTEAHNPYAALSLVSWADGRSSDDGASSSDKEEEWSDNRDMSIFSHEILYQTPRESKTAILNDSQRRGHLHGLLIRTTLCVDATKGPKKGKTVKNSVELEKRITNLLQSVTATATFLERDTLHQDTNHPGGVTACVALVQTMLDLCRIVIVICSGKEKDGSSSETLESREQRATELFQSQAMKQLQEARQALTVTSVKDVCSLLPNYIVPLFAMFRMSSNMLALFGWGKRKRHTKKCAGALAEVAVEFSGLLETMLSFVERLPSTELIQPDPNPIQNEEYRSVLDDHMVYDTATLLIQAQYRTRTRVEPILQEMKEELDSFDVSATD